ncbi:MAG: hypothetical protein LC114_07810 [Bryobacterales bacterium]|nr:hypothetical protein [Bryobacterales bacterium]
MEGKLFISAGYPGETGWSEEFAGPRLPSAVRRRMRRLERQYWRGGDGWSKLWFKTPDGELFEIDEDRLPEIVLR